MPAEPKAPYKLVVKLDVAKPELSHEDMQLDAAAVARSQNPDHMEEL